MAWNAVCMRCGFEYKNHQLKKEWTGHWVCGDCFETRHPQDFAKIPRTEKPIPWSSPEPQDVEISVSYNTTDGVQQSTIPSGTFNSNTL